MNRKRDWRFLWPWFGRCGLVLLSVLLLTLALAPIRQFYLAWVGLVPWLWVAGRAKTHWRAFLWSWLAGILYLTANMWWLVYVSGPGLVALVIYLGLYWGVAALIFRGMGWIEPGAERRPSASPFHDRTIGVLSIAVVYTALEWMRGTFFTGLPWLYLGHTQSPFLLICQIADVCGVYGITFCVATLNALVLLYVNGTRPLIRPTATVGGIWLFVILYGVYRWQETPKCCSPGPTIVLVQPNFPQDNKGDKGATEEEREKFHIDATTAAVKAANKAGTPVDLICWSETMMPAINIEMRTTLRRLDRRGKDGSVIGTEADPFEETVAKITALAQHTHSNLLTGALFWDNLVFDRADGSGHFTDRRNSAFLFERDGRMAAERADKVHLVPFGEFIPFKDSKTLRWLHDIFQSFSPYNYDYTLTAGSEDHAVVMTIDPARTGKPVRLIVPICFEDIDAPLVAKMLRGPQGKNADLIVNLTNDGWFQANQNSQHLQAAVFRSIENRVPTARSVNTGISAFIDSFGRVVDQVPVRTEGTVTATVAIDRRYTFYTRFGDVFAIVCVALTGVVVGWIFYRWRALKKTTA